MESFLELFLLYLPKMYLQLKNSFRNKHLCGTFENCLHLWNQNTLEYEETFGFVLPDWFQTVFCGDFRFSWKSWKSFVSQEKRLEIQFPFLLPCLEPDLLRVLTRTDSCSPSHSTYHQWSFVVALVPTINHLLSETSHGLQTDSRISSGFYIPCYTGQNLV